MRVALATCAVLPEPDPDEAPLLAALRARGFKAETLAWDDPDADPSIFDCVVLRATWNYYRNPDAFLNWVERTSKATRLLNPIETVRWNIHKGYLRELEAEGAPIVPTEWIARRSNASLCEILERRGWNDCVLKPSISASSYRTARFSNGSLEEGQAFLDGLLRDGDAMVQKYMASMETVGERSLVWIDGEVTHAAKKRPRLSGDEESVSTGDPPSANELEIVHRALEPRGNSLLYARVDLMREDDGTPKLSELELIEPSLFFDLGPGSADRFADALARFIL